MYLSPVWPSFTHFIYIFHDSQTNIYHRTLILFLILYSLLEDREDGRTNLSDATKFASLFFITCLLLLHTFHFHLPWTSTRISIVLSSSSSSSFSSRWSLWKRGQSHHCRILLLKIASLFPITCFLLLHTSISILHVSHTPLIMSLINGHRHDWGWRKGRYAQQVMIGSSFFFFLGGGFLGSFLSLCSFWNHLQI